MKLTPLFWLSLSLLISSFSVEAGLIKKGYKAAKNGVKYELEGTNLGEELGEHIETVENAKESVTTGAGTVKGLFDGTESVNTASNNMMNTLNDPTSTAGAYTSHSPIASALTNGASEFSLSDATQMLTEDNIKQVTSLLGFQNADMPSYTTGDVVASGLNSLLTASKREDEDGRFDTREDGRFDTTSSGFQSYLQIAVDRLQASDGTSTVDLGSSGLQWSFSSKSFLETALGVVGNAPDTWETLQSVGSGEQSMTDLLGLITEMDMTCGWQASIGGNSDSVNINFRDKNEVIHLQIIPQTLESQSIWIQANFPQAEYFSYQTFIVSRNGGVVPTGSIADFQIQSNGRTNPYTSKNFDRSSYNADDEYDIYFTTDGTKGYENEVAYNPNGLTEQGQFIVLVHHIVLDENIRLPEASKIWGGVEIPAIRVKALDVARTGAWFLVPNCNGKNDQVISDSISKQVQRLGDIRDVDVQCPLANLDNNFISTDQVQFFDSKYEDHITSCATKSTVDGDLITVIEGVLPAKNSVRYSSFSIVDLLPPGVNKATITDDQIRSFYDASEDEDLKYNIVLAPTMLVLNRCGLTNLPDYAMIRYVPMGNTMNPGIVYREVMGANFEGKTRDTSLHNALDLCEKQGDCYNPLFFNATMHEFYPQIQYFQCNFFGKLEKAPAGDYTWTNPNFPTEIPTPSWAKLERENPDLCVPKLEMKVTTKSAFDLYVDGERVGFYSGFDGKAINKPAIKGWGPTIIPADNTTTHTNDLLITDVPDVATVAVKFPREGESILIDMNACGEGMGSDYNWRCTDQVEGDNWIQSDFDDSNWPYAGIVPTAEIANQYPGITYNPDHSFAIQPHKCASKSRFLTNIYCRGKKELSCTRYCTSSNVEKYSSFCNEEDRRVGVAHVSAPAQLEVYANGEYLGQGSTTGGKTGTLLFSVPDGNTPKISFAIKAIDYSSIGLRSAFIADFSTCGLVHPSNPNDWKCTNEVPEEGWISSEYDDSEWQSAMISEGQNGVRRWGYAEGVSPDAYWLWSNMGGLTPNRMQTIYCRSTIDNPLYSA